MVQAGCVFVAGIHPSRTWMSGSLESVRLNACVHRPDLGLYSHPKEFWENGVRNITPREKSRLSEAERRVKDSNPWRCITQDSGPNTLYYRLSSPGPLAALDLDQSTSRKPRGLFGGQLLFRVGQERKGSKSDGTVHIQLCPARLLVLHKHLGINCGGQFCSWILSGFRDTT